jgi:hypothetical protein
VGEKCPGILSKCRFPHYILGSFKCRKATTKDRRLYFPSKGRRAEDFFALKMRRLRPGANPRTWVPKTSRLPKSLTLAGYCYAVRHGKKVQLVTPYRVSHLQRYSVTVCGNVTSVYPPLIILFYWLKGPCRTLASYKINFQTSLYLALFLQPLNTHFLQITFTIFQLSLSWLSNGPFPLL